ncbi:hypothetical protein H0A58_03820 [Alcaligenaceae bacterium]|nr:hypothetical protein [Alcaligenaceae bacterium]
MTLAKNQQELDKIRAQCQSLVTRRSLMSAGAAVVPIPGVDLGTDVAILMKLIPTINEKFGLSPEQIEQLSPDVKKMVVVGGASMSLGLIGKTLTTQRVIGMLQRFGTKRLATKALSKYIPFAGSAVAAGISYYILRKVGRSHIDECYAIALKAITPTSVTQS